MIFATDGAVDKILSGEKTQTRRLVKEGECIFWNEDLNKIEAVNKIVKYSKDKKLKRLKMVKKWQVGRDYAVQTGRGKSGVWYCPKCKNSYGFDKSRKIIQTSDFWYSLKRKKITPTISLFCYECKKSQIKPLRIVIKSIRKECLLDISDEDAKKEGYKERSDFLKDFCGINKLTYHWKGLKACENPYVWVLDFGVKK